MPAHYQWYRLLAFHYNPNSSLISAFNPVNRHLLLKKAASKRFLVTWDYDVYRAIFDSGDWPDARTNKPPLVEEDDEDLKKDSEFDLNIKRLLALNDRNTGINYCMRIVLNDVQNRLKRMELLIFKSPIDLQTAQSYSNSHAPINKPHAKEMLWLA